METTRTPLAAVLIFLVSIQFLSFYAPGVSAGATSTSVSCSPNPASVVSSVNCTATVSGSSPTGNVTWSTSSSTGFFSSVVSQLFSGTCTTTYFDNNTGYKTITASYLGDLYNSPSSGSTLLTVFIEVAVGADVTVQPTDDLGLTFASVTTAGVVIANETPTIRAPPLNNRVGPYYDVNVTASYVGNVTVSLAFDGSNMTQEQKSNLKMMEYTPLAGDMSGTPSGFPDGVVNMKDISYLVLRFGTTPVSPYWDPYSDISGPGGRPDGVVNMRDIAYAIAHFNERSNWVDITWYVDAVQNVVYGQTTHFSFIGIH